jgi:hypothetical protein
LIFFLNQNLEQPGGFASQIHGGKGGRLQLKTTVIRAGDGQQGIDQCGKAIRLLKHAADGVAIFFATAIFLKRHLADAVGTSR